MIKTAYDNNCGRTLKGITRRMEVVIQNNLVDKERYYYMIKNEGTSANICLQKLRKEIRGRGRGDVEYAKLEVAYINKSYKKLEELLQELYLDYISESVIDFMYAKIKDDLSKLKMIHERAKDGHTLIKEIKRACMH